MTAANPIRCYLMEKMMQPMLAPVEQYTQPPVAPQAPKEWVGMLNAVRVIALACRASSQADLFQACALLSNKEDTARNAHATALVKCFREATNRKPVFFRPGSAEISFDESWLMRAVSAAKGGDSHSFEFLIRSRVATIHQRNIAFLIKGISEQFSQV